MFDNLKEAFSKKEEGPRKVNYIWPLAGGYLAYLGGKLLWMCYKGEGGSPVISVIAGVIFMVVGGLVIRREWNLYRSSTQNAAEDEEAAEELPENTEEILIQGKEEEAQP